MLKALAIIVGLVFIAIGIMGFMPSMAPNERLFDLFSVNAVHNLVHLAAGIIAVWAGFKSSRAAKVYFQVFGVIYLALGVIGFFHGDRPILGILANNMEDSWLHTFLGVLFLYLGLSKRNSLARK